MMTLNEGLTYEWDSDQRDPYASESMTFIGRISDTRSKKIVRKVRNQLGNEAWPWQRASIR